MKYFLLQFCGGIAGPLNSIGWEETKNIEEAEAVIFGGGTDISTSIYRQPAIKETSSPDKDRDRREIEVYKSLKKGVWKIGICRGSQLLCALAGGTLWQHTNNHSGTHTLVYLDPEKKDWALTKTNSVHHQVCRPPDGAVIIGFANESTELKDAYETIHVHNFNECEIWAHSELNIFGFQGHPEYGHKETTEVFLKLLQAVVAGKVK